MSDEPRRLTGHTATATFCIASRSSPGLVVTAGEDGRICCFDMRCKCGPFSFVAFEDPITSLCFNTGREDIIYSSSGTKVKSFDRRLAASEKLLDSYNYNKDEINQVACNVKSSFLATADDSGDIKIIDIQGKCLYKTLRDGHRSICSSVQFLPWRPWEVITGGLDSKLLMWDFSKGRSYKIMDFTADADDSSTGGQCLNPAFVHAIAIPDVDMLDKTGKVCVVARGDGIVDMNNIDLELATIKPKSSAKPRQSSQSRSKVSKSALHTENPKQSRRLRLDHSLGGHTAAVSCVAFSLFGEQGKFIVSGGNDKLVKIWDWSRCLDARQGINNGDNLCTNIILSKKVNWICTTPCNSENLVVCDTTKVVKVYTAS